MDLKDAIDNLKFDVRMIEMNLKSGLITKEEYNKYLESLGDESGHSEKITFSDESEARSEAKASTGASAGTPADSNGSYVQ